MIWPHDHDLARQLERIGCEYLPHSPNDYESLRSCGVTEAISLMACADDDRLNLQVALKARDINPKIRLVMRQFNRTLARKLEQNLPNCSVLSMASHSAASIVGAALDRSCFYALQFPDLDGVLCGFSERSAARFGVTGMNRAEAQAHTKMRVIALDGVTAYDPTHCFTTDERLVVFGEVRHMMTTAARVAEPVRRRPFSLLRFLAQMWHAVTHADPIVQTIIISALVIYFLASVGFAFAMHLDPVTAAYFVGTTMTTTGYGDVTPLNNGPWAKMGAVLLEILGVGVSGIFIAIATSALTRAQFVSLQGLRQIRTREHVLVCGAGNVGTRVIEFLEMLGQNIVVVEANPDSSIVELSRARTIELMTGDATRDSTLDLCHVAAARSVVAITNSDTANLEVALGVRGRNPTVPVVMRVADENFAGSIARQFEAITTLSTSALAAPAFAGLSRFPGTRARIAFGDDDYNVGERPQGEVPTPPPAEHCTALAVWRNGSFLHINDFDEMEPFDRLLFIVPLSQFRAGAPRRERQSVPLANTRS